MAISHSAAGESTLSLSMDLAGLDVLRRWIADFSTAHALPPQTTFDLDLVLTEAVTNVMTHARCPGASREIEVACTLAAGRVAVRVSDDGPPFDPAARGPVTLPRSLGEAEPGGLGVHLMRRFTANMTYRRENDRNILRMDVPVASPIRLS